MGSAKPDRIDAANPGTASKYRVSRAALGVGADS
jgi:hypothetical protein